MSVYQFLNLKKRSLSPNIWNTEISTYNQGRIKPDGDPWITRKSVYTVCPKFTVNHWDLKNPKRYEMCYKNVAYFGDQFFKRSTPIVFFPLSVVSRNTTLTLFLDY